MPTYLVRLIDNQDLVGIFVARNVGQVALAIDECTEPEDCEYIVLGTGGIIWLSKAIPIPIEMPEDDDFDDPMPWDGASFTDTWWNYFYGLETDDWIPIDPDRPPPPPEPPERTGPGHGRSGAERRPVRRCEIGHSMHNAT